MAVLLASCSEARSPSTLEPRGPAAERIEGLWWLMLWISTAVFIVVVGFLIVAVMRGHRKDVKPAGEVGWGERFIVISGVIIPTLILGGVFVFGLRDMAVLAVPEDETAFTIEVVAHDWWWEARYPNGAVSASEIHIPVGERVQLRLTTADVIHSFWVPQLQAKTDHIPGRVNSMWLEADRPGRYRGQCAEFCGVQHANMLFYVVAQPPEEFEAWLANEASPAPEPTGASAARGKSVFLNSSCVGCHAIRGTEANSDLGPDLTHIAQRKTIGSGILENNRENMARFILDPRGVKPGVIMPPTELSRDELEALLDYLEQLR